MADMTQEELDALYEQHPEFTQTPAHLNPEIDPLAFLPPVAPATAPQPAVYSGNKRTEDYADPVVTERVAVWEEGVKASQDASSVPAPARRARRASGSESA